MNFLRNVLPGFSAETQDDNPAGLSQRGRIKANQGKGSSRVLEVLNDPFDSIHNPNGYVNLGVAENYCMHHRVRDFINEKLRIDTRACSYGTGGTGSPRLKMAMTSFLNEYFEPYEAVKPEQIQFYAGCGAICEMLAWNLAEAGDAVIASAPIYGAFDIDFTYKAALKVVHVSTCDDDPAGPKAPRYYEDEIEKLVASGVKPRILLICNPHNPLGKCYDRNTMKEFCNLAAKYNMHLVCDEVYALSLFSPPPYGAVSFTSILSISPDSQNLSPDRIHVLYSFSKDIAAAGLRLGCLITRNKELRFAVGAMSPMHWSSSLSETAVAQMLEDRDWLQSYIADSQRMLLGHFLIATRMLDEAGIRYYQGTSAGFFIWVDLAPFIPGVQIDKGGEDVLSDKFFDAKVWINKGQDFFSDRPGWFRIVFTQERKALQEGVKRVIYTLCGPEAAERSYEAAVRSEIGN